MKAATAVRLATPTSGADRGRFALIAGATAAAGALLVAALHILRLPTFDPGSPGEANADLANYVTEGGLRGGVVIATLLLTVPVFALAVQALRVGSVARDRRMASLRLAGATPGDVRRIAAAEAGGAALAGGLLAGPAYVLLWIVAGVAARPRARACSRRPAPPRSPPGRPSSRSPPWPARSPAPRSTAAPSSSRSACAGARARRRRAARAAG